MKKSWRPVADPPPSDAAPRFDARTENHVYFLIDEMAETVHVLAIWGAPKGRAPKL